MGWLEMGDTEGGRGHLRMGDGRMQHLQQVDEQVYKYVRRIGKIMQNIQYCGWRMDECKT